MKFNFVIVTVLSFLVRSLAAQEIPKSFSESFSVLVKNPLAEARESVPVIIDNAMLQKHVPKFNAAAFVVLDNGKEIASQFNANDKIHSGIVVVLDEMKANEERKLTVHYQKHGKVNRNYRKRTQAELSHKVGGTFVNREYTGGAFKNVNFLNVPREHKDHSWFIRYEGPGWESDLVGYRFYLDQRNATDVFGKKTKEMILQQVGLDGFDSYHNMQPWGMDVMKVGKSLGLGSPGAWRKNAAIRIEKTDSVNCRITENSSIYSSILTQYKGWKIGDESVDVQSFISIHAGTELTHQHLVFSKVLDSVCTGIVKDKVAKLFTHEGDDKMFGYIATYGKQSLNSDELGLAVFFDPNLRLKFTEDEFSNVVVLRARDKRIDYYFMASWVQSPNGIRTEEEFLNHVKRTARFLSHPVKVSIVFKP